MDIKSAEWVDAGKSTLKVEEDGRTWFVPASTDNRHYREVKRSEKSGMAIKENPKGSG